MAEQIKEVSSKQMYLDDMVKYSIIVNRKRAIPELKDGLKPVQRKILFDMFDIGATSYEKRKKSAKVVGDTLGNWYCHGDQALYGAMEPISNWWKCKIPLLSPHGNWGTLMNDPPAAMRYTESGLSQFGLECIIGELAEAKYVVDWTDNFDGTKKEPEYLPAKVPILIINGTFGIGVGIAVSIPTHNLTEVLQATRALIKNPKAEITLIPDHCQPLIIFNADWKKISKLGYGSYTVRGIVEKFEDKGYPVLSIKSLPDGVTTDIVVNKLLSMVEQKQLPMIKDIIDHSGKTVDIRIILRKGADINYVEEILYNKTPVQSNVSVNFEVIDGVNVLRLSYKEYLQRFIDFRAITKFRLYANKYQEVSTRLHKLETFIKFIESGEIDNIIAMVKKQKTNNNDEIAEYLIKKLNITDLQAGFILSTSIQYLSKGHLERYKQEFAELQKVQNIYRKAITDDGSMIMKEIDEELEYFEKKYGTPRICKVVDKDVANNIPKGVFKIVITEKNFIRKISDVDKVSIIKGDNPKFILRVDNTENILLWDNKGKVYKLPVHKIPVTDKSSAGTDVRFLIRNLTADIISVHYEPTLRKIHNNKADGYRKHYITIVTKNNIIKKLDIDDFLNVNASGLMYSKIRNDDEVVDISIIPADLDLAIYSNQKALRCKLSDIPLLKRISQGNKAMNTSDPIEGLSIIYPDTQYIVVVTRNGYANKFPINCLAVHSRGKSGNNVIKLNSNDSILKLYGASDKDILRLTTPDGIEEVSVADIKSKSGIAAGQKITKSRGIVIKCEIIY